MTHHHPAYSYDRPVHLSLTMWLADIAGFGEDDAYEIAKYDQAIDDDPLTQPLWDWSTLGQERRAKFHFVNDQRLQELERSARSCTRGKMGPDHYQRIGSYLHAFEDVYAHKSHHPQFGHLLSLHTPDQPWSHPSNFVDMVERKFEQLLTLRALCGPLPYTMELPRRLFLRFKEILNRWKSKENALGTAPPRGRDRFDTLVRNLYGDRYQMYTVSRVNTYEQWLKGRMTPAGTRP